MLNEQQGSCILLNTASFRFFNSCPVGCNTIAYCFQVMKNGMIVQSGRYREILQQGSDFAALIAAHESSMELMESAVLGPEKRKHDDEAGPRSKFPNAQVEPDTAIVEVGSGTRYAIGEVESNSQKTLGRLINDEERACGHVSLDVYKHYMTAVWGWWAPLAVVVLSVLWQGMAVGSDYWLAYGTSGEKAVRPVWFIQVYAIMTAILVVIMSARSFLIAFVGLKTASKFFKKILCSILCAPMSFFDTTPSGRVLSRVRPSVFCLHYRDGFSYILNATFGCSLGFIGPEDS